MFSLAFPRHLNPINLLTRMALSTRNIAQNLRAFSKHIHVAPTACLSMVMACDVCWFTGVMWEISRSQSWGVSTTTIKSDLLVNQIQRLRLPSAHPNLIDHAVSSQYPWRHYLFMIVLLPQSHCFCRKNIASGLRVQCFSDRVKRRIQDFACRNEEQSSQRSLAKWSA